MIGLNVTLDIYRLTELADDAVGGSVRTEELRYSAVKARISALRPPAEFRVQGIELPRTYEIILWPDIYSGVEPDDILIPRDGQWASQRLRVTGVQLSSVRPGSRRSHIQLSAIHTDYADREE